ncbi:MAG: transglycosylase SLT domain-containing protein [Pyrinomonadaceae bacterium]
MPPLDTVDTSDKALDGVRSQDQKDPGREGSFNQLDAAEHFNRARVYFANRAFEEARSHLRPLIEKFPNDPHVTTALFLMGRTYFQEQRYTDALPYFQRLARDYSQTFDGREGFYYVAVTLLRLGQAKEAVDQYKAYVENYPPGERVENAYLNIIDGLREADLPEDGKSWVDLIKEKFKGKPTEVNAMYARLRLDISVKDWSHALEVCDELRRATFVTGVTVTLDAVNYLRAYCLEQAGRVDDAIVGFSGLPDEASSYYGNLATQRLAGMKNPEALRAARQREANGHKSIRSRANQYPVQYRDLALKYAKEFKVDPRFILSIMKQESGFRANAKSGSAARGLMQLTIDTAMKYAPRLNLSGLREQDLYTPKTSIQLGSAVLGALNNMFPRMYEAVAASYNGGEENVARWIKRSRASANNERLDPGVFTAEVGFDETKGYVNKVMANFRAYRQLYTEGLLLKR